MATTKDIIEKALVSSNSLVQRAMEEERAFRKITEIEIEEMLIKTRELVVKSDDSLGLLEGIHNQIDKDLQFAKALNESLKPYAPGSTLDCSYPLKYNKLELILAGSKEFLSKHFIPLFFKEIIPEGYRYKTDNLDITHLGENKDTIYGSSKNTFLKTSLIETYSNLSGIPLSQFDFQSSKRTGNWIEGTAVAHVTTLPQALSLSLSPEFKKFTFLMEHNGKQKLIYPHSGYTFGGDRREECKGKPFVPEDCSSWMEKMCSKERSFTFTTQDQLFYYRLKTKEGIVTPLWKESETHKNMDNTFEVVENWEKDPQEYIQSGQVYAERTFDLKIDPHKTESRGTSGHTGLVLGFKSNGPHSKLITMDYARNMPTTEGFGVNEHALFSEKEPNRKVMLFNVKKRN